MKRRILLTIPSILLIVFLIQCNNLTTGTIKSSSSDPFKKTIVPSQLFTIDGTKDNVIEGKNGTTIVCPQGCFKDPEGKIVDGSVEIELAEALSLEDMLLSNLTTTSDGKPLETDGMIYFNATSKGQQLTINKEKPVHIEIPTLKKVARMMVYKGIRDENGNMNWIDPKPLDNFLETVDIHSLDFLPDRFQDSVDAGMPFRKHETSTQELTDSLYYSLSASSESEIKIQSFLNYNEPYYNQNKEVRNGKYTPKSYETGDKRGEDISHAHSCGIDPAIIKVIKSDKYQNTLIATKEFEERLKVIFSTCDVTVLEIYLKNLDKNLYELDSMAALYSEENRRYEAYHAFDNFFRQRLTKVKDADKYSNLLKEYYEKQLPIVKAELEKEKEKVIKALQKKSEKTQKVVNEYKKLLWKREKHRMKTYGFTWTETGWINIDNGTVPKNWDNQLLEIKVENGKEFDDVYTYVVYSSIKSLYRLNSTDNEQFYVGNNEHKEMLMPKKELAVAVAIGYTNGNPSIAIRNFETGTETKLFLALSPSTIEKMKEAIRPYEEYSRENSIIKDLKFMTKLAEERQRQKAMLKESEFLHRLWGIAYPCCATADSLEYQ